MVGATTGGSVDEGSVLPRLRAIKLVRLVAGVAGDLCSTAGTGLSELGAEEPTFFETERVSSPPAMPMIDFRERRPETGDDCSEILPPSSAMT